MENQKENKINFLQQIDEYHCILCHKDYNPMTHHSYPSLLYEERNPCTEKCGKWFEDKKLQEDIGPFIKKPELDYEKELAIFRGCFNAIFNAVMTGKPITSVNWNEKIGPNFRKIEDLIKKLLRKL